MSDNIKSTKSQTTAFVLNLFLGFLGVHKFYLGKPLLGVVYLLTWGLFGIGWTIDTFSLAFMSKEVFAAKYNQGVQSNRIGAWARVLVLLPVVSIGLIIFIFIGGMAASSDGASSGKIYNIGEVISEKRFKVVVKETSSLASVGPQISPPGATYIAAVFSYENVGVKPVSAFDAPEITLVDAKGTEYKEALDATIQCNIMIDSTSKELSDINPGITLTECSVFEVSEKLFDVKTWKLKVSGTGRTSFVGFVKQEPSPPSSTKPSDAKNTSPIPTNIDPRLVNFLGIWGGTGDRVLGTCQENPVKITVDGIQVGKDRYPINFDSETDITLMDGATALRTQDKNTLIFFDSDGVEHEMKKC